MTDDTAPPQSTVPTDPPHWKFWGTLLWGLFIAAVFVFVQALVVFAKLMIDGDVSEDDVLGAAEDGTLLSLATFGTTLVCCAAIAGIIKLRRGALIRDYLALHAVPPGTLFQWLAWLAVTLFLSDAITTLLGKPIVPDVMIDLYTSTQPTWLIWVALIVAAPLFEEVFFRGFLFQGFQRTFLGTIGTVVVTSGLWACLHLQYDAWGIFTIFVLGLLLGAARARTGSLLVPLLMHSVGNFVATVETVIVLRG